MPERVAGEHEPSDTDLIRLVKDRHALHSPRALGCLYERYNGQLWKRIRARVYSADDAGEIAAETWARVLVQIYSYEDRGRPFLAWLLGIAYHVNWERLRTDANVTPLEEDSFQKVTAYLWRQLQFRDANDDEQTSVERSVRNTADQLLLPAISTLNAAQREIILLRYYDGCETLKDVADRLGANPNTVRVYHKQALNKIRLYLAERGLSNEANHD